MHFTLDRSLFDVQSQAEAMALVALLSAAVRDPYDHAMLTDPIYVDGGDNSEIDIWLSQRLPYEVASFRTLLTNSNLIAAGTRSAPKSGPKISATLDATQPRIYFIPGSIEIRVERRKVSDWENRILTLADAVDLLLEPVHLVLENARTEVAFVKYLAGPTNGAALGYLIAQPGRIAIHGGGTGEAKRWIEDLTEGPKTPDRWRRMLRAWILFDQDSGELDACAPSSCAVKLMRACEDVVSSYGDGLSWICLRRREIESYVPNNGLLAEASANHANFVNQVVLWRSSSNPLQQSHVWALDLKLGLCGDLRSDLPKPDRQAIKQRQLQLAPNMLKHPFCRLAATEVSFLERGLGERLGEALLASPAKPWTCDLPGEYDRGPSDQVPRLSFVQSIFDRM